MKIAVAALAPLASASLAAGLPVYQGPGANATEGWYAVGSPYLGFQARAADDFTISGGPITRIGWWGRNVLSTVSDLSNLAAMNIVIYGSGDKVPDSSRIFYEHTFDLAALTITATGKSSNQGNKQYKLEAAIDSLVLGPGTYWLSIGGILKTPTPDTFMWSFSDQGNNQAASFIYPQQQWFSLSHDAAFEIIPGPGGVAMLGMSGLLGARRRR